MSEAVKMFAMLSAQGTACDETALCQEHNTPAQRRRIELSTASQKHSDPAVLGTWRDCTPNDALECQVCGRVV